MSDIENNEEDEADVGRKEGASVPIDEDGEAVGEQDQDVEEEAKPRKVRLERSLVWELVTGDVLVLEHIHKADVAQVDERPADETGNGRDVQQPVEHSRSVVGQVEESQQTKGRAGGNSVVRGSILVDATEELGRMALSSHGDQDTAAGVNVRVGSRQDCSQQNGVDDGRERLDASELGNNDERRGRGVGRSVLEVGVVIGHVDADEEDGAVEEQEDGPKGPADGRGDGLARVSRLTSSNDDQLRALETEAGRDEHRPEADKLANLAIDQVRSKRTGVSPVLEANVALVTNTGVDADAEDDEADNGNDLDARQYWMMRPLAVSSRPMVMTQLNQ